MIREAQVEKIRTSCLIKREIKDTKISHLISLLSHPENNQESRINLDTQNRKRIILIFYLEFWIPYSI